MHRPVGVSAGIVSIGRMPGRVVEKFEVGLFLRRRRNVVNKYQASRKCMYAAISVGLYLCRRRNNYDCALNIKQRSGR